MNGLILNGGLSSRMGSPKSEIQYHNKPQHQYLFELLSENCEGVFFSVKKNSSDFPYPQIEDQLDVQSPINGIYSALKFLQTSWLVVANDMPLVNKKTLGQLLSQRDPKKIATCFFDSSGERPEPLLSIWEPTSLKLLEIFLKNGGVSPRNFLETRDIKLITIENPEELLNINSKEELEIFRNKNIENSPDSPPNEV